MKVAALIFSTIMFAQTSKASEIVSFNINVKSNIQVTVQGVYQTQKDSVFCKKISLIDGAFESHQKIKDVVIDQINSTGNHTVNIPVELNDSCQNKLVGMGIHLASNSPLFNQSLTVSYQDSEPKEVQKILIGPTSIGNTKYYVSNISDIKLGPDEKASLSVEFVNFDPLPPRK